MSRTNADGLIVETGDCWVVVSRPAVPGPEDTPEEWADYLLYRQRNTPGWIELSPSSVDALRQVLLRAALIYAQTDLFAAPTPESQEGRG